MVLRPADSTGTMQLERVEMIFGEVRLIELAPQPVAVACLDLCAGDSGTGNRTQSGTVVR